MAKDEPDGLDQSGKIVNEVGEINELPQYKSKEEALNALRKAPEVTYVNDDHKWVDIEIPKKVIIGKKYKIKISKKVPHFQFAISQSPKFEVVDKMWRPNEPPQLYSDRPLLVEKLDNVDKYEGVLEDIRVIDGNKTNVMPEGEYLFEAQANGKDSWQQTTVRRIVNVTKK